MNIFSMIDDARGEFVMYGNGDPDCLILGLDRYAELCGAMAVADGVDGPLEVQRFLGMEIVIGITRDGVSCGKFTRKDTWSKFYRPDRPEMNEDEWRKQYEGEPYRPEKTPDR